MATPTRFATAASGATGSQRPRRSIAQKSAEKLIASKLKKGYLDAASDSSDGQYRAERPRRVGPEFEPGRGRIKHHTADFVNTLGPGHVDSFISNYLERSGHHAITKRQATEVVGLSQFTIA